ncbi:staphylopine uptake ABC transporter ATP-binding protein CntD [Paenibacillus planticolens]|uniref:ATP-binding cassette domain-containing protein n=1 Tax=Paenibacillus planticolens TaxID=2654976 RepID=A0ABX1ZM15_9BACL|nr:ABC transporter ATP-binding protein [Paenibacillus planticolens]NOV00608.1 ATP-binding cassette domain-containing protein [Paenibacillus planticolens]
MPILEAQHLKIWDANTSEVLVSDSSFSLKQGSCLAIVGESGSGKSLTCRALMRLNRPWMLQSGDVRFKGESLMSLSPKEMRKKRGKHLYMIVQNGMRAFDPSCVVGVHAREMLAQHFNWNKKDIEEKMIHAMKSVMLKNPLEMMNKYPHELSGGMLQRMMIALALVIEPEIIIADEPTTALDTISQFEVVEQLIRLRERTGCSMILVSHDLGIVKKIADEVLVMRDGAIVENGQIPAIFTESQHPYTQYLVASRLALSSHFKKIMEERVLLASR